MPQTSRLAQPRMATICRCVTAPRSPFGVLVAVTALALGTVGCGSATHAAHAHPCTEEQRQEHPLACEKQSEREDPELAHTKLLLEAQHRARSTPRAAGETVTEHEEHAQEEIEAERAGG